jgi:hypothetical protein
MVVPTGGGRDVGSYTARLVALPRHDGWSFEDNAADALERVFIALWTAPKRSCRFTASSTHSIWRERVYH